MVDEFPQHNVSSTQEIVELILDSNRNNLLALDLRVSIATMGLGAGALFAGLFGMNVSWSTLRLKDSQLPLPHSWPTEWRIA